MLRLGWAETKILFCVRLSNMLSPAQQGVVPAPIQISLVVWFLDTLCARSLVLEHLLPILPFFIGGGVTLHERLVGIGGGSLAGIDGSRSAMSDVRFGKHSHAERA